MYLNHESVWIEQRPHAKSVQTTEGIAVYPFDMNLPPKYVVRHWDGYNVHDVQECNDLRSALIRAKRIVHAAATRDQWVSHDNV